MARHRKSNQISRLNQSFQGSKNSLKNRNKVGSNRTNWELSQLNSLGLIMKHWLLKFLRISTLLNHYLYDHQFQWPFWTKISKSVILLRLPSKMSKKTFHYYSLSIFANNTAKFFLKVKKFKPGLWINSCRRSQSATGSNFHSTKSSSTNNDDIKSKRLKSPSFYSYFGSLKWFPIPLSLGFALIAFQHYRRIFQRANAGHQTTEENFVQEDWEISCYRKIPWKSVSRLWGWVHNFTLPEWARSYVLGWYATTFDCDLSEAETDDLKCYKNLSEFFRRNLKSGTRPINLNSSVVSPADGTVFHVGKVEDGVIEQVKGVRYSVKAFLGPYPIDENGGRNTVHSNTVSNDEFTSNLLHHSKGTNLYYAVIYLAPGDYHRFHSPTDWTIKFRRHFAGELLSVNRAVASWIGGLFSLNERAVYFGKWKHGFFSMTAVGATNVGSIRIYKDPTLQTNSKRLQKNSFQDHTFSDPITLEKGDSFGEFNLGSTIVLIFEAPKDFQFTFGCYDRIRVGQGLSCVKTS